jgi:cytoskeletal protein CcmA (bactofilin family)
MFKNGNTKDTKDQPNQINRFVEGTNIKGDIVSESNIRLDGELVGDLTTTGKLVVGPTGKITGNIICSNADIEGSINGTIKVDEFLYLKATAVFKGDITTGKISIDKGAAFSGTHQMNDEVSRKVSNTISTTPEESDIVY